MIRIKLEPKVMIFRELSNEILNDIIRKFDVEYAGEKHYVKLYGEQKELYEILYFLSLTYDLEIV